LPCVFMMCCLIKHKTLPFFLQQISCSSECHVIWINSKYTIYTENIRTFRLQQELIKA
jgi:hypothetical protein